jgi:diguanylate cyclase (GGDEF)-like protein
MDKPFALIIEDDRDVAALFRHVMDLAGFQTEVVFHGQAAIERLSNSQPDITLLDLNLPGVSGNQILESIRKDERLNHTKVVVITAYAHIASGLSIEPELVLLKPISIEQLTTLVDRICLSEKSPKAIPWQQEPLDPPTGLYNQAFFKNRLESALKQSREIDPYHFGVFLFKLEPKSRIKNQPGAYNWDFILHEMADALRSILRPTDTIARFDRDTFYILIENIPNGEISIKIANRIQEILYRKISDIGNKIRIPIRIGILLCDRGYAKVDVVLGDAKYALALASAQGDEYSKYYYQVSAKKPLSGQER